jgi:hypothetical protein
VRRPQTFQYFGFWFHPKSNPDSVHYPRIEDYIDPDWTTSEPVLSYLDRAPTVFTVPLLRIPCRFCGLGSFNLSTHDSDGTWLWPETLLHEVILHKVRLPEAFIAHMEAHHFEPPTKLGFQLRELPRPAGGSWETRS